MESKMNIMVLILEKTKSQMARLYTVLIMFYFLMVEFKTSNIHPIITQGILPMYLILDMLPPIILQLIPNLPLIIHQLQFTQVPRGPCLQRSNL